MQAAAKGKAEAPIAVLLAPGADAAELGLVRRMFASVRQESGGRDGAICVDECQLDCSKFVKIVFRYFGVEPDARMKLSDEVSSSLVAGSASPGVLLTGSLGFDGAGVTVAVADSGLNNGDAATMHPDLSGGRRAFFYYGTLTDAADEHSHGTHVAGIIAGNGATGEMDENGALYGSGVAPGRSIVAQRIFDGVGRLRTAPQLRDADPRCRCAPARRSAPTAGATTPRAAMT